MISFGGYVNQSEIIPPCTINSRIQQREKSWIPPKNHRLHYTRYTRYNVLNLHTYKTELAEASKGIESNYENKEKEIAGLAMY